MDIGVEKWMLLPFRVQLVACTVDFQSNSTDDDENAERRIKRLRETTQPSPPDLTPQALDAVLQVMNGLAAAESDQAGGGGGRNRGSKSRSKPTHNWEDAANAERRQGDWVTSDPRRARRIQVLGGPATG